MKLFLIILSIFSFLLSHDAHASEEDVFKEHISLLVHENLINAFFDNMGKIKGEGSSSVVDYSWYLLEPRIEINPEGAAFYAKIRVKGKNFRVTRDVVGTVSVTYDKDINILQIKIDKAEIILDVDIFGTNFVLGNLDIAKHFGKPFRLDGPKAVSDYVEFPLPTGELRKIDIKVVSYNLELMQDAIKVSTSLGFNIIE